jgi:hypothetical protein
MAANYHAQYCLLTSLQDFLGQDMQNLPRRRIAFLGIIIALIAVILVSTASIGCKEDSYHQLQQIAKPYAFDFVSWELHALSSLPKEMFCKESKASQETMLRSQIKNVLTDNAISAFPPIIFKLEKPPHLLVVSPREKIVYLDRMMLRQELSVEEMERLEVQIDELGFSSLVVKLGGLGATYPPIVGDNMALPYTINTAVEEWLHQYLAFRPLGFLYLLDSVGIKRNPDVVTMNETLAGIISKEIGAQVYARYYKNQEEAKVSPDTLEFDFDAEMRETRKTVDCYLSQGKIEEAERYMEERRKEFVAHGYYIRKLNQAYFAFHGIYGQDPASVSPVYRDLEQLRAQSPSLKYFLDEVASMRNYAELTEALEEFKE